MTRLVLLDRDGVLNEDRPDSVRRPEELVLLPRAAAAVRRLNEAQFAVAVVTNQSIVGRGVIDDGTLAVIHEKLRTDLASAGAWLDALYVAPDRPDCASDRRKPGPGMLREALADFGAAAAETPMIGDSLRDMEAAAAAGCQRILVRTGKGRQTLEQGLPEDVQPVEVVEDLWHATDQLVSKPGG